VQSPSELAEPPTTRKPRKKLFGFLRL
jgi:hypothetical protein